MTGVHRRLNVDLDLARLIDLLHDVHRHVIYLVCAAAAGVATVAVELRRATFAASTRRR